MNDQLVERITKAHELLYQEGDRLWEHYLETRESLSGDLYNQLEAEYIALLEQLKEVA